MCCRCHKAAFIAETIRDICNHHASYSDISVLPCDFSDANTSAEWGIYMIHKKVKIKNILSVALFTVMFFSMAACGKEAYLDDYKNETVEEARAEDREDRFTFLHEGNDRLCTNGKGLYNIKILGEDGRLVQAQIYYYDYATNKSSLWCSNVSCTHDSDECSAYVGKDEQFIEYSNGYIYKIKTDDSGIYLVRYNEDGSNETKTMNLLKSINGSVKLSFGRIYKNHFYYIVRNEDKKIDFYRVDLDKKDDTEYLFSRDASIDSIAPGGVFINDKNMYISSAQYIADIKSYRRVVYQYNFSDKTLTELVKRDDYYRSSANDNLYIFTMEKELFKVTEQGEFLEVSPEKFKSIKDGKYGIYCNECYIVLEENRTVPYDSSERMIYIYDIDKDILNGISIGELRGDKKSSEENLDEQSEENLKETDNGSSGENVENQSLDMVKLSGLTGNYCIITDYTTGVYHMIELDSVSDEKISSWDIKF